jgi:branched-subunit amino acid transport protein AzlD
MIFKWLRAPASIPAMISVVVFIVADLERMKTLPSVAAGTLVLACLVALGAGLLASYAH